MSSALETVRTLHAPLEDHSAWLACGECTEGRDGDYAHWPCASAEAVYSDGEIEDFEQVFRIWQQSEHARTYRKRMATPWSLNDDLAMLWRPMIKRMLAPMPIFGFVRSNADGTVTFPRV